jgi:hypothetical protein
MCTVVSKWRTHLLFENEQETVGTATSRRGIRVGWWSRSPRPVSRCVDAHGSGRRLSTHVSGGAWRPAPATSKAHPSELPTDTTEMWSSAPNAASRNSKRPVPVDGYTELYEVGFRLVRTE